MHVTKPIDLTLLERELTLSGIVVNGLGHSGTDTDGDVYTYQGAASVDLPPDAAPVVAAHDAGKPAKTKTFEAAEDAERVRIVNERARDDPAFAALAELVLKEKS